MIAIILMCLLAVFFSAWVQQAHAQAVATLSRLGVLSLGTPPNPNLEIFVQQLGHLGHIENKNLLIEYRFAKGKEERLADLAAELVRLKVNAIFTSGTPATLAVKKATKTIPTVFFSTSDPVGTGVVASLAHPSGNITGISAQASDLWPKRLELLREILPKLSRIAMVWNKNNGGMALEAKATEEVAGPLGIAVQDRGVKNLDELETVFSRSWIQSLILIASGL